MTELMTSIEQIVRAAGDMMRTAFNAPDRPAYSMKGQQDYLTVTDGAVEQFVREQIARRFPGDGVLGEEAGGLVEGPRLWIVDPIDGTANFARQIPHFCISLGLMVDGVMEAGAIYEPMHDELYIAQRGQGNIRVCRSVEFDAVASGQKQRLTGQARGLHKPSAQSAR